MELQCIYLLCLLTKLSIILLCCFFVTRQYTQIHVDEWTKICRRDRCMSHSWSTVWYGETSLQIYWAETKLFWSPVLESVDENWHLILSLTSVLSNSVFISLPCCPISQPFKLKSHYLLEALSLEIKNVWGEKTDVSVFLQEWTSLCSLALYAMGFLWQAWMNIYVYSVKEGRKKSFICTWLKSCWSKPLPS